MSQHLNSTEPRILPVPLARREQPRVGASVDVMILALVRHVPLHSRYRGARWRVFSAGECTERSSARPITPVTVVVPDATPRSTVGGCHLGHVVDIAIPSTAQPILGCRVFERSPVDCIGSDGDPHGLSQDLADMDRSYIAGNSIDPGFTHGVLVRGELSLLPVGIWGKGGESDWWVIVGPGVAILFDLLIQEPKSQANQPQKRVSALLAKKKGV